MPILSNRPKPFSRNIVSAPESGSDLPLSFLLLGNSRTHAAFFGFSRTLAQRAFCAAEMRRRAAADSVRRFLPLLRIEFTERLPVPSLRSTEIALSNFLTCANIRLRSSTKSFTVSAIGHVAPKVVTYGIQFYMPTGISHYPATSRQTEIIRPRFPARKFLSWI